MDNKYNYLLNTTDVPYIKYWFDRKIKERLTPQPIEVSGEGTDFTLTAPDDLTITEIQLKGDSSQQSYTGKNQFNIGTSLDNYFLTSSNGSTITSDSASTRVTATFTANTITIDSYDTTGWRWISTWINLEKNTNYTISAKVHQQGIRIYGLTSNAVSTQGTLLKNYNYSATGGETFNSGDYDYYIVSIYPNASNTVFSEVQIEEGSTATDFEQYVGGIPSPNTGYPQTINVVTGDQTLTITNGEDIQSYSLTLGSIGLCKIGTAKDIISKDGDDWYVINNISKIDSYNGESISTNYISTTGSLSTGATVYYVSTEPTSTKITDDTLLEELENILSQGYLNVGDNTIETSSVGLPVTIYIKGKN